MVLITTNCHCDFFFWISKGLTINLQLICFKILFQLKFCAMWQKAREVNVANTLKKQDWKQNDKIKTLIAYQCITLNVFGLRHSS